MDMNKANETETVPQLLTVKDLCAIGLSRDVSYSLMHAKGFPAIKIGGKYYVSKTAFIKWLTKHEGREISF